MLFGSRIHTNGQIVSLPLSSILQDKLNPGKPVIPIGKPVGPNGMFSADRIDFRQKTFQKFNLTVPLIYERKLHVLASLRISHKISGSLTQSSEM